MKLSKDILKTIGAVLIIGVIVVLTFLYGNKQRQDQVARDNQLKSQKAAQSSQSGQESTGANGQVAITSGQSGSPSGGTDAVKSPEQTGNINQNSSTQQAAPASVAKPAPALVAATPAPAATPVSGGSDQPVGGGTIPDTGSEMYYVVPGAALVLLYAKSRRRMSDLRRAIVQR